MGKPALSGLLPRTPERGLSLVVERAALAGRAVATALDGRTVGYTPTAGCEDLTTALIGRACPVLGAALLLLWRPYLWSIAAARSAEAHDAALESELVGIRGGCDVATAALSWRPD